MYNVLLFSDVVGRGWVTKPLGPYRLATELRKHGYTVKVIDYLGEWLSDKDSLNLLLKKYVSNSTLFIGFSGVFYGKRTFSNSANLTYVQYSNERMKLETWPEETEYVNEILLDIRQQYPHVKLVYGGVYDTKKDNDVLDSMDFIIRGFADKKIIELADHLSKNTPIRRNILNKKIIDHDSKGLEFDFPNSQVLFTDDDDIVQGEVLPLEISRGCMFSCSFCGFPLLGRKKGDPEYIKQHDSLVNELVSNYQKFNITKYMIVDDTFNETTAKLEAVLRARDKANVDISFSSYIRLDLLARYPEQISLLKELGIQSAFLGIESLNWESAKSIGKGIHPDKIKDTLFLMKDQWKDNVSMYGSFILGLPYDTEENANEWIPWLMDESPLNGFEINALGIFPGHGISELSKNYEKYGYRMDGNIWTNKKNWSLPEVVQYAHAVMSNAWDSNRLKVSGWDLMGLQNMGFKFQDLINTPLREVDRIYCSEKIDEAWTYYKNKILS